MTVSQLEMLKSNPKVLSFGLLKAYINQFKERIHFIITTQACFKCVPTFCGSIIIHIFTLLFFLIEYSKFTDRLLSEHVAGYCTSANALMLGAIHLFYDFCLVDCFKPYCCDVLIYLSGKAQSMHVQMLRQRLRN